MTKLVAKKVPLENVCRNCGAPMGAYVLVRYCEDCRRMGGKVGVVMTLVELATALILWWLR